MAYKVSFRNQEVETVPADALHESGEWLVFTVRGNMGTAEVVRVRQVDVDRVDRV